MPEEHGHTSHETPQGGPGGVQLALDHQSADSHGAAVGGLRNPIDHALEPGRHGAQDLAWREGPVDFRDARQAFRLEKRIDVDEERQTVPDQNRQFLDPVS